MAESPDPKSSYSGSEHFGQARDRRNNLTLEIRVANDGCHGANSPSIGSSQPKLSIPSSPESGHNERQKSLKIRKGALLHHFLHPLDYYHERKTRSSTSSINSDVSESGGYLHGHRKFNSTSVSPVPFLRPLVRRKAKSTSSNTSSPRVSPLVSPSLYTSVSHHNDFGSQSSNDSKHPDGHNLRLRKFGRQISSPVYSDRFSVSPPNKTNFPLPKRSLSPPKMASRFAHPIPTEWRPTHRRSLSDGNTTSKNGRGDDILSSSSSESSSGSSSESEETESESISSLSYGSEDESEHHKKKKGKHHTHSEAVKIGSPSKGAYPPHKSYEKAMGIPCSPAAASPVNKFLLSVISQEDGGVLPAPHVDKSLSHRVTHSDNEEEVFGSEGAVCMRNKKKTKRHEKRACQRTQSESIDRTSSVEKLYSVYEEIIKEGQLHRRHSMDPDRRRHGSGGFGAPYIRGDDPNQAAILFRDCRGLPAAAPFLENFKRSELEEDESQILVKFFKYHHTYDLIPTSAKLVIFDTRLQVKKAFYALVYNGVRAAPLWDAVRQEFVGMLTITDFIRILQSFYNSANRKMEELEDHRLEMWRTLLSDDNRKLISIGPNECLYDAIRALIHQKIHRLPVIDPLTGNVLYIITHKRILKFLYLYINELPKPMVLQKSLRELDIGTYDRIETARGETLIIEALNKFVERRISALPIVDDEGKLIDIYAKFDVINLAAEGTYHNLDVTLHQANEYRNEWFEGVLKCDLDESLGVVMERIVRAEVHRLVVVDKSNKVIGIISLSDILNELVLKPCNDDPLSMRNRTIGQMETTLSGGNPSPEINVESLSSDNEIQNSGGTAGDEDWGGTSDLSISEDKLQERKSSAESEENFDLEVNNLPDSMTSQGVISISS